MSCHVKSTAKQNWVLNTWTRKSIPFMQRKNVLFVFRKLNFLFLCGTGSFTYEKLLEEIIHILFPLRSYWSAECSSCRWFHSLLLIPCHVMLCYINKIKKVENMVWEKIVGVKKCCGENIAENVHEENPSDKKQRYRHVWYVKILCCIRM